jgi:hypothetical protein
MKNFGGITDFSDIFDFISEKSSVGKYKKIKNSIQRNGGLKEGRKVRNNI